MMFAGIYYSTQRLVKARLASDFLSQLHFWGWQAIIVAAAVTLPFGLTRGKEYAELIWPINIDGRRSSGSSSRVNFFWTLARRNEPQPLRRDLVLHRDDRDGRDALHRQPPVDPDQLHPQLSGLRRGAGRPGAVVVRPQRRGLLPHHADPRHHVLLRAEGGGAAGVFLPAVGGPLLVAGLRLHLGRPPPPAQHRAARTGCRRWG